MNLIYQCFIGQNQPAYVKKLTGYVQDYAKKCGADYHFEKDLKLEGADPKVSMHRYFNILQVLDPECDKYENIFYLDCDILPDARAKNIFAMIKPDDWIMASKEDRGYNTVYGPAFHVVIDVIKKFKSKYLRMDCPLPTDGRNIIQYNTGVVVFTKKGRIKLRESLEDWKKLANDLDGSPSLNNDQPYLNGMFVKYDIPVREIGWRWNLYPFYYLNDRERYDEEPPVVPRGHFYHFSNPHGKHHGTIFTPDYTPEGHLFSTDFERSWQPE